MIVLDVFLGIIAVLALGAAWNRLRARRRSAGTNGILMLIERQQPRRRSAARFQAKLRIVGPVVRYDVALDLEADGTRFDASPDKPATRPSMGCNDEELSWSFEVPEEDTDRLWLVASWVDANGYNLRTAAIARQLTTSDTYEWKWYFRRFGDWRKQRNSTLAVSAVPGHGPLELGRAPDFGRAPRTHAEPVGGDVASTQS
jgi:hypothetical protein